MGKGSARLGGVAAASGPGRPTVQESNEWKSYATDLSATADIKNEDIGAQARDAIKSITDMVGGIAGGAMMMPILIIGGILFFFLVLIRGFPGGGKGNQGTLTPEQMQALSAGAGNVMDGVGRAFRPGSGGGRTGGGGGGGFANLMGSLRGGGGATPRAGGIRNVVNMFGGGR